MTITFSRHNSINLCPASFCTPRPNLPGTPGISWLPTFAFQPPIMKSISFQGVSSRSLISLHRTIQLQLLQHYLLGHRLGLLWYWMVCLGNEQRSFCHFWDCCISDSLVNFDGYSISPKGLLPTVVEGWSSELNSPIPVHFSSPSPKVSMFTLAISYLTTSNLPWSIT